MPRRTTANPPVTAVVTDDLDAFIREFTRHLDAERKSRKTIRLYGDAARDLARFLRDNGRSLAVATISHRDVEDYFISLRDRLSPATQNQVFRSLQSLWRYLERENLIGESPQARRPNRRASSRQKGVSLHPRRSS